MSSRRRWLAIAGLAAGSIVIVLVAMSWFRGAAVPEPDLSGELPVGADLPANLTPVEGNPGWESLPAAERGRAGTPMSDAAREWLIRYRQEVVSVAGSFDVSPIALGGIVAAEQTLLVDRMDDVAERVFVAVFGRLREPDLERWVAAQERGYQREAEAGLTPEQDRVRTPYLWTLGPAQVSFRLAVRIDPQVAATMDRPRRNAAEVLEALTTVPGSLEYAAALLAQSRGAYAQIARLDIGGNPGVMATLYHLGAPTVRARRLTERAGAATEMPQVNFYGAWVNLHADEVARLLEVAPPMQR